MNKPKLIIVQGFIGAGKTTYSKKLSEDLSAVRLNGDEYCEAHFTTEELEADWDKCFSQAITSLWCEAEQTLKGGHDVILDFGFWDRKSRDYARSMAYQWNVEFEHIYLDTPDNVLLERLSKRSGAIAENNIKNFDKLKTGFEQPADDENHIAIKSQNIDVAHPTHKGTACPSSPC